ncbi:MAG: response regulator [Thermodesulfobacteriota bacterium]|nr:response regulator [Thermodesulfobacteriota bacterium]
MIEKILIVDDSPVARKMLKNSIPKDKGYEIFEATDGRDGIKKYQILRPQVVFMDLTMPDVDGYKALEEIRKLDKNAMVIVTTADVQPKSISNVMELGAFTLLKKPAKAQIIEEALSKAEMALKGEK